VKCAAFQSLRAEEHFLRMLREAVMIRGENISKEEVIFSLAEKLASIDGEFKINRFKEDIKSDKALEALRKDVQELQYSRINRFPSLVIRNKSNNGVLVSGYRPYSVLLDPIKQMVEVKETKKINPKRYKDHWPFITERELAEIA
jgi:predicted DsbA family dithiol-disulfide isomerase